MQLTLNQKTTCIHWCLCNSPLSVGPASSGSGIQGSVSPGSCTHPAPAHNLVYMQSEMCTLISHGISLYTSFSLALNKNGWSHMKTNIMTLMCLYFIQQL